MPGILKRWDGTSWVPSVGSPAGRTGPLAVKAHKAATNAATYSTNSTTLVNVDATNLAITFIVPPSGQVLVNLRASQSVGSGVNTYWAVHDGTAVLQERLTASTTNDVAISAPFLLTGLTPGASKTLTWQWRVGGAATSYIYTGPNYGQAVMEVWDAVGTQREATAVDVAEILHVRDEKPSGTSSGTLTLGAWQIRELNTIKTNEIAGATLTTNEVSLPAGIYEVDAKVPAWAVDRHQTRLYNVTGATTLIVGTSEYAAATDNVQNSSHIRGRFTLGATSSIRIEHQSTATKIGGLGVDTGFGEVAVYADLIIRKVG